MFKTHESFEFSLPLPAELFGENPGIKHWKACEVLFNQIWFLVELIVEEGEGEDAMQMGKSFCVAEFHDAIGLVTSEGILQHRINAVIPTYFNDDQTFKIKPLIEVFSAKEQGQQSMMIFVARDGSRYVQSLLRSSESDAEDKTLIYTNRDIDNFRSEARSNVSIGNSLDRSI